MGGERLCVLNNLAGAFKLGLTDAFKRYQAQIVKNAQTLAAHLMENDIELVSNGTDNHMMLVDLTSLGITGKKAESVLEQAGITVNKNTIPFETQSPFVTSGIRIGTPAVTTRGMKADEMHTIGDFIVDILKNAGDETLIQRTRERVQEFCSRYPLFQDPE